MRSLENLKKSLDEQLKAVGCTGDDRPFHPHLTLGRAARLNPAARRRIAEAISNVAGQNRAFGVWRVERIDLMESELSSAGAIYTTLDSVPLDPFDL